MATFYVRKDGSGTHTQIVSAIYDAVNGDIIDIGPGTFNENVEFMGKSLTLKGAGMDQTIIQGKLANDSFTGCSWFAGDDIITTTSTAGAVRGKVLSNSFLTAGSKLSQIISATQFKVSVATSTSGNYSKTVASLTSGSSSVTLPNTTSVAVGHKVEGTGVNATITAWNATTKVMTLSSPVSQSGINVLLNFRVNRTNQTISQIALASGSSVAASIMFTGASDGMTIKDLTAVGFDGPVGQEAAALGFSASTSPGHQNFLIEGCRFTANGDSAVMSGPNPYLVNGTIQNCIFDGKTFTGSEPADVPAFSSFSVQATVQSIGASSVIQAASTKGIVVGATMQSPAGLWTGSASVTAISGNNLTINKNLSTSSVGAQITCTVSNVAYSVPNVARNLVYIGQNSSPCNTQNITFKNNSVKGATGSVISATGGKTMFNSAVTIESVGGLVENNVIDGSFGAGDPNPLMANFAIRCRQANIVVKNNVNKTSGGRGNSGFYVTGANAVSLNNTSISMGVVQSTQASASVLPVANMDKDQLKSISKVSSSPVFSAESNWVQVSYIFKHKTSAKRMIATFRSFDMNKTDEMPLRGGQSGDQYELHKIILCAANRTILSVKRSEISDPSLSDYTLK